MTRGKTLMPTAPTRTDFSHQAGRADNSEPDPPVLLSSLQVADFVGLGYLRFDGLVPDSINEDVTRTIDTRLQELGGNTRQVEHSLQKEHHLAQQAGHVIWDCFEATSSFGQILRLPVVRGAIESLVGPDPWYDHHAVHLREQGTPSQNLHGDGVIDTRAAFDIQLMYYPSGATAVGGATMIIPGSHLRQINGDDAARYQNIRGQTYLECSPGTVVVLHHGIWHGGRRNRTPDIRCMVKFRMNPRVEQVRLWDTSDLEDPEIRRQVREHLDIRLAWHDQNLERLQRVALFRHISGQPDFSEVEPWLQRLINQRSPHLRDLLP